MAFFEDSENLQAAISKTVREGKSLFCFVTNENEESNDLERQIIERAHMITAGCVALRLIEGSEQANYLHAVVPIESVPAIIIIDRGQAIGKYFAGITSLQAIDEQVTHLAAQVDLEAVAEGRIPRQYQQAPTGEIPRLPGYIELPDPQGRMRLPNNAYDGLRTITQSWLDNGVSGKPLLQSQLGILRAMKLPEVTAAVEAIEKDTSGNVPSLTEEAIARLLNTSSAILRQNRSNEATTAGPSNAAANTGTSRPPIIPPGSIPARTPSDSQPSLNVQLSSNTQQPLNTGSRPVGVSATNAQRAEYVAAQKAAEAEQARVRAQIEADKKARREADRQAREHAEAERRRAELLELRKANSTTSNPQASDIRIQVRTFDGATIRNSFARDQTISKDVRPWIDQQLKQKGTPDQPYNLKLVLTPLPNRSIETGEEDLALADVEDVRGSATLIMVPVKTFVEGYGGAGSGVIGGAVGAASSAAGSVLTTGFGLVNAAAGTLLWGLSRLMGATTEEANEASSRPEPTPKSNTAARDVRNMRIRTLADQRRDEDEEAKRRGTNLYNGMGLNVEPRKDENDSGK